MTSFILKIIALISMTIDHCTVFFGWPEAWALLGRFALPLYGFMIIDSYNHVKTDKKRLKKYLIFIIILAVVSEFVYDYASFGQLFVWDMQNQILQFLLLLIVLMVTERIRNLPAKIVIYILAIAATFFLHLGYLGIDTATMIIMTLYLNRYDDLTLKGRFAFSALISAVFVASAVIVNACLSGGFIVSITNFEYVASILLEYGPAAIVLVFIFAFYNGRYGNPPKWFRIVYKYYYPAHMLILMLIGMALF